MKLLVSLYIWLVWIVSGIFGIPPVIAVIILCPREVTWKVVRAWILVTLALCGIRVRQRGLEQVPRDRVYLMMCNHVNLLDPFVWQTVVPVPSAGLEKKENFKIPFYGWLIGRWGNVPIDRTNVEQAKRDFDTAVAKMRAEGMWMMICPEGTRTRDGKIGPFKKGGFHLALETGLNILPMTMNGAYEVQARGSFWARPGTVEMIYHPPIDPANYDNLEDLMHDVREAIAGAFTGPRSELDEAAGLVHQSTH